MNGLPAVNIASFLSTSHTYTISKKKKKTYKYFYLVRSASEVRRVAAAMKFKIFYLFYFFWFIDFWARAYT